jgi:membrane protein implicated in regulation of membrane protease activity
MARKLSRRKQTAYAIVGMGLASGIAAVLLWPYLQRLRQTPLVLASSRGKVLPGTRHIVFSTPGEEYLEPGFDTSYGQEG